MKGLILAGGRGTRLQPISDSIPKHLVPIANKPVIDYAVEALVDAGIHDIGIVVNEEPPTSISEHLNSASVFNAEFTYIVQDEPKGLSHAIQCSRDFVDGKPFIVYFGDTVISKSIVNKIIDNFQSDESASIGFQEVEDPTRFGIARLNGAELIGIEEKPRNPPSSLAYVGAVVLNESVFDVISTQEPSDRGELELTDTLDLLLSKSGNVSWQRTEGLWRDVGKPKDVIETNRTILDRGTYEAAVNGEVDDQASVSGPVSLGEGSVIEAGAAVQGPVHIGRKVTIGSNASIGQFTSISDNTVVKNARIESSVIMYGAEIVADIYLCDSVIGQSTEITNNPNRKPKRYVLGRGTSIEI